MNRRRTRQARQGATQRAIRSTEFRTMPGGPLCAEPAWIEERARRDEIADGAEHDVEEGRRSRQRVGGEIRHPAMSDQQLKRVGEPFLARENRVVRACVRP